MLKFPIASETFFTQFLVKEKLPGHVRSYDVAKGTRSSHFLRGMTDYCTLEGDIDHDEASFDHFRSELTCLTPMPFNLLVKVMGQVKVKVRSVT